MNDDKSKIHNKLLEIIDKLLLTEPSLPSIRVRLTKHPAIANIGLMIHKSDMGIPTIGSCNLEVFNLLNADTFSTVVVRVSDNELMLDRNFVNELMRKE